MSLCGVLTGIQLKRNKEQKPWAAMQIEDRSGSIDGMVFAASYERLEPMIVEDQAVLVRGLVLPEENAPPKISVQEITPGSGAGGVAVAHFDSRVAESQWRRGQAGGIA